MKPLMRKSLAALAFCVAPFSVTAVPIGIGAFSGGETVINFDTDLASSSGLTIGTVSFTNDSVDSSYLDTTNSWSSFFSNIPGASLGDALRDPNGNSLWTIDFSTDVNRVGALLSTGNVTTWTISAYAAGDVFIESTTVTMPGRFQAVFFGLETNQLIDYLVLDEAGDASNGYITVMDDLRFEAALGVPEPTSLVLLSLGLAGFGYTRRKAAG